jgi:SAM domain (Sterile alpha motif)
MDIVVWLRSLGLGKYEAAFRENEIDEAVLPNLTAEDLKELGVTALGHRRRLLDASLLCVATRAARRCPLTQRPRQALQPPFPKTVPSAAK